MKKEAWIDSDNFLKRCFAIWGHFMVAHLIIAVGFFILFLLFMILVAGLAGSADAARLSSADVSRLRSLENQQRFNELKVQYPELREASIRLVHSRSPILYFDLEDGGRGWSPGVTEHNFDNNHTTVHVAQNVNPFRLKHIILYEFGHYVWWQKLDKGQRDLWCSYYEQYYRAPSRMGLTNCEEHFSSWFAYKKYGERRFEAFSGLYTLDDMMFPENKFLRSTFPKNRWHEEALTIY